MIRNENIISSDEDELHTGTSHRRTIENHHPSNQTTQSFDELNDVPLSDDHLEIKIITHTKTFSFSVRKDQTIQDLKQQIIERFMVPHGRSVRLIFRGRILDDRKTLESYSIESGSTLHCSISDHVVIQTPTTSTQRNQQQNEDAPLRGFDRLRDYGFSPPEISQIRLQFHTHRMVNSGFLQTNADANQLQQLEEDWINSEVLNASNRSENEDEEGESSSREQLNAPLRNNNAEPEDEQTIMGTNEDMFKGLLMGFLLGLIMLLWLPDRSLPLRTKIGIVAGLSISFSFGLLKMAMNP